VDFILEKNIIRTYYEFTYHTTKSKIWSLSMIISISSRYELISKIHIYLFHIFEERKYDLMLVLKKLLLLISVLELNKSTYEFKF